MSTPKPGQRPYQRRSTRVTAGVFLDIRGTDKTGKTFMERRVTLDISFQGCKYFSRYALPMNSWVTMEISNKNESSPSKEVRARVVWCRRSQQLGGLFQVGVEFEKPGNIWEIADPPDDWQLPEVAKAAKAAAARAPKVVPFEQELRETLRVVESGTYYQVLRVTAESPRTQIRQNYHEMVRKFHPDRHMDQPQWSESLHRIMEAINVSYKTLTDENERKKYDEEISLFDFAKKHRESQITAEDCLSKARQALKDQNPGETLIWLRRAVEMDPSSAKYLALLGRALSARAAQRQEATEAFEKSLELDPWNISVRWQLASLYMEMQLPWRARPHFAKVLEIDPENTRALERLRQIDGKDEKKSAGKRSFVDRILHPTSK